MLNVKLIRENILVEAPTGAGRQSLVSTIGVAIVIASLFWFDFLNSAFGVPVPREMLLGAGLTLCLFDIVGRFLNDREMHVDYFLITMFSLNFLFLLIQVGRGYAFKDLSFSIGPVIAAILVVNRTANLRTALLATMAICVAFELFESTTQTFVFVYHSNTVGTLDAKEFLGNASNFRAKGLFAGPITTTAFLALNFLHAPSAWNWLGVALGSTLAFGRNGQFFALMGTISMVTGQPEFRRLATRFLPFALIVLAVALAVSEVAAPDLLVNSLTRFLAAFNMQDSANLSRVYMWEFGFGLLADHDTLPEIALGIPDQTSRYNIMGVESSVLSIGIEYGVVGLMIYAIGLARLAGHYLRTKPHLLVVFAGLIVYISTVSMLRQLGFCVLLWCTIFESVQTTDPPERGPAPGNES